MAGKKKGRSAAVPVAVARVLDKGDSTAAVADELGVARQTLYAAVSRERKRRETAAPKAGIRQGKAVAVAPSSNGTNDKNPHELIVSGLRAYAAFEIAREVERQLPAAVAREMTRRLGGKS